LCTATRICHHSWITLSAVFAVSSSSAAATTKDVADVTVGDGLGEWKTKKGSCEVVNANVVHWD